MSNDKEQLTCDGCLCKDADVKRRRQNTAYTNDESNFATLCNKCQKDSDDYWSERWADYYAGCL